MIYEKCITYLASVIFITALTAIYNVKLLFMRISVLKICCNYVAIQRI